MCGIAGFSNADSSYQSDPGSWNEILNNMNKVQKNRGPDEEGTYLDDHCALAHVRPAPEGPQPRPDCKACR